MCAENVPGLKFIPKLCLLYTSSQDEDKFSPLLFVKTINGDPLEIALKRRPFERLTPRYPKEKRSLDTGDRTRTASRLIDLIAPIGKGQRGMIVAPVSYTHLDVYKRQGITAPPQGLCLKEVYY